MPTRLPRRMKASAIANERGCVAAVLLGKGVSELLAELVERYEIWHARQHGYPLEPQSCQGAICWIYPLERSASATTGGGWLKVPENAPTVQSPQLALYPVCPLDYALPTSFWIDMAVICEQPCAGGFGHLRWKRLPKNSASISISRSTISGDGQRMTPSSLLPKLYPAIRHSRWR